MTGTYHAPGRFGGMKSQRITTGHISRGGRNGARLAPLNSNVASSRDPKSSAGRSKSRPTNMPIASSFNEYQGES